MMASGLGMVGVDLHFSRCGVEVSTCLRVIDGVSGEVGQGCNAL